MSKKKSTWKHKLAAVCVSFVMIAIVLLLGEAYCRLFTRINFLDNSRDLLTANRYGRSYGNTPNFTGISFGETFYTDANGFRFDPDFGSSAPGDAPALLIVGDSVAFGPAIKDDKTIAGHLRKGLPGQHIYNAAAIGYDAFDYKNVAEGLVSQKPEIKSVVLLLCLNDINDLSAQQIKLQANSDKAPEQPEATSISRRINDFLRSRSKLYIWFKNVLQDTQMLYFQNDLAFYQKDENVQFGLQPLADLKQTLSEKDVRFTVFIVPHEAQLRPDTPDEFLLPQKKIGEFLVAHNIEYYDLARDLKRANSPKDLFLFGDPMHLSETGHKVVAQLMRQYGGDSCVLPTNKK